MDKQIKPSGRIGHDRHARHDHRRDPRRRIRRQPRARDPAGCSRQPHRAAKLAAGHDYADGTAHPWHRQPVATLRKVRADLRAGFAPGTANQSLAAIRGALRVAWQDGSLDHGDYSRRVDALKSVPGSPAPGRVLTVAQVRDLFAACAADPNRGAGARDAALMAVLFGLGLRRGEARAIQAADLDRAGGTLTVRGKAGRDRLAYLGSNGADAAIGAWLKIRGDHDGPLFAPVNRGGRVRGGGMSLQAISARVAVRGGKPDWATAWGATSCDDRS